MLNVYQYERIKIKRWSYERIFYYNVFVHFHYSIYLTVINVSMPTFPILLK